VFIVLGWLIVFIMKRNVMAKSNKTIALEQKAFHGLTGNDYSVKDLEDALKQGLDVNATFENEGYEMNLITACILTNKIEFVKALLPYKPDMEQKVGPLDVKNVTPLMTAAILADYDRSYEMVEFLIKVGAKISQKSPNGLTVLDLIKEVGDADLVALLEKALETENIQKRLEEQKKQEAFNLRAQKQKVVRQENLQKISGHKTSKPRRRPQKKGVT